MFLYYIERALIITCKNVVFEQCAFRSSMREQPFHVDTIATIMIFGKHFRRWRCIIVYTSVLVSGWKLSWNSNVKGISRFFVNSAAAVAIVNTYPIERSISGEIGTVVVDGDVRRAFNKATLLETSGEFSEAQTIYEEIVETVPDFIYGWSNLGNVLTAQGYLKDALLCYKKALSLRPPSDGLSLILLNKAAVEMTLGDNDLAYNDIKRAESVNGMSKELQINEAVVLSRLDRFHEANTIFDRVINTADRNPFPWWIRYSLSLVEDNRGIEAVAFTQRLLNRFPEEPECNAFAAALYTVLSGGSGGDGKMYWAKLSAGDQIKYRDIDFLREKLFWGPRSVAGMVKFQAQL